MEVTPITATEAIRRIQERDHVAPPGLQMNFEQEQELIAAIRARQVYAGLTDDGQLAFIKAIFDG